MGSLTTPGAASSATLIAVTDYDTIPNVGEGDIGTLFTFPLPLALLPDGAYVDFEGTFSYALVTADAGGSAISLDCGGGAADVAAPQDFLVGYFRVRITGTILQGTASLAFNLEPIRQVPVTPGTAATPGAGSIDAANLAPTFTMGYEVFGTGVAPATIEIYGSRLIVWG